MSAIPPAFFLVKSLIDQRQYMFVEEILDTIPNAVVEKFRNPADGCGLSKASIVYLAVKRDNAQSNILY